MVQVQYQKLSELYKVASDNGDASASAFLAKTVSDLVPTASVVLLGSCVLHEFVECRARVTYHLDSLHKVESDVLA